MKQRAYEFRLTGDSLKLAAAGQGHWVSARQSVEVSVARGTAEDVFAGAIANQEALVGDEL